MNINNDIEILEWKDVRSRVSSINKELADIIDDLSPNKKYKLIKAKYSFGDLIVKNGKLYLPSEDIDKIKSQLSYAPIPLSLILNKACEIFVNPGERAIPLNVFSSGNMFGTFELMNYLSNKSAIPIWDVSAGSRTIFMLPKLSDSIGFKRLRAKYNIPSTARLQNMTDHWEVFKYIAKSPEVNKSWQCEIIFFTEAWFKNKNDPQWNIWHQYLSKIAWLQSQYTIEKITFSVLWQKFIGAIISRSLKPSPYLVDTVKHIFSICSKSAPTISPVDHKNKTFAPIYDFQQAFIETYQLKHYLPTIMCADPLNSSKKQSSGYYSLSYPTLLEGSPQKAKSSTIMLDLRDIKQLIDTLLSRIETKGTPLDNVNFEYFHTEDDIYKEIKSSDDIANEDERFLKQSSLFPDKHFCKSSLFWRGTIRINFKESN